MKDFSTFVKEDILDDIAFAFPELQGTGKGNNDVEIEMRPAIKPVARQKQYKPRRFKGKKQTGYADYIRTERYLKLLLKEKYKSQKLTLKNIIDLFATHNLKIDDTLKPKISLSELHEIREYDRELVDGWTGKNTTSEMEELRASIKAKGIQQYGVVQIVRKSNGSVTAILGEGNHRVSIGRKLRVKKMPILFTYQNE